MSADEVVDVVDDQDRVVAQATRREVRRQNLRHRCVYILVFSADGQLFVHQRTQNKDVFPGYWDVAIGGVVASGENYDAAARRELREETGLDDAPPRRLFALRYEDEQSRVCGMVYSCTTSRRLELQASEIASGEWLDLDVVLERTQHLDFCPDGIEALRLYLSKLAAAHDGPR